MSNVLGQFLVIFVVCDCFGLLWDVFVEYGLLGLVSLRIVVCAPFGRHMDLSACFGWFLPCFFHLVAPRGASAASVARHQRGKSRRKSGKMRKRLSLSLPGFFFCSSRSLLSIVFSLRTLWHFLVSGFPGVLSHSLSFPRFPLPCLAFFFFPLW